MEFFGWLSCYFSFVFDSFLSDNVCFMTLMFSKASCLINFYLDLGMFFMGFYLIKVEKGFPFGYAEIALFRNYSLGWISNLDYVTLFN